MSHLPVPWLLAALALAVGGVVALAVTDGAGQAVGLGLIGLAAVIAVSAVFYAVGISEERDRERDANRPPPH
jgi:hypothetical protein